MIAFIDQYRSAYGVEPICRVLPIAPSTYHTQSRRGRPSARAARHGKKSFGRRPCRRGRARRQKCLLHPLADLIAAPAKAEREGTLREKIRFLCRSSLLVVDEIGYLPVTPGGGNLFFQLVNARYEKGAMILTSTAALPNGARSLAIPSLPRPCSTGCCITPSSSRSKAPATACASTPTSFRKTSDLPPPGKPSAAPKRRGRPPSKATTDQTTG
jgi:hypothetical protein